MEGNEEIVVDISDSEDEIQIVHEESKPPPSYRIISMTIDGKKKYKCFIDKCQAILPNFNAVKSHVKNVHYFSTREKCPFKGCSAIIKNTNIKNHLKEKHCDRQYECGYEGCNRKFTFLKRAEEHRYRVHSPHERCLIKGCDRMVKSSYMKYHLRKAHNILDYPNEKLIF